MDIVLDNIRTKVKTGKRLKCWVEVEILGKCLENPH